MKRLAFALTTSSAMGLLLSSSPVLAQCTTCSPLSLPSATLVGADLEAARRAEWALVGQASTGWVAFPRQVINGAPLETFRPARFDLLLSTVQASILHRSGLGLDAVLPFGALLSREGDERRSEVALGDAEIKQRATTLLGRTVRVGAGLGAALPTGGYTERSGAGALGEASRALTIGRGVYWIVAETDVRWQVASSWPNTGGAPKLAAKGRVSPDGTFITTDAEQGIQHLTWIAIRAADAALDMGHHSRRSLDSSLWLHELANRVAALGANWRLPAHALFA